MTGRLNGTEPDDIAIPATYQVVDDPEALGRGIYRLQIHDDLTNDVILHDLRLSSIVERAALARTLYPGIDQHESVADLLHQLNHLARHTIISLKPKEIPLFGYEEMLVQPNLDWAIDGLLPLGVLASLTGKWGAGKSFLALGWALAMGRNEPWLGRETRGGGVVYVAAEGCRPARLLAHEARFGRGQHQPRVWWRKQSLQLADPKAVDAFLAQCDTLPNKPKLVILDTLARCTAGLKENDASDMAIAIEACDRIIRAQGSSVLVLHHPGHGDGNGGGQKRGRGSSAFDAACDTTMVLTKRDGGLLLEVTKQKDAEEGEPVRLRLVPYGPALVVESDDLHANIEGHLDPDLLVVLQVVRDAVNAPGGTDLRALVKRAATMSTERAAEAYAAAKARGLIQSPDGRKQTWTLSDKGRMALALHTSY